MGQALYSLVQVRRAVPLPLRKKREKRDIFITLIVDKSSTLLILTLIKLRALLPSWRLYKHN